MSSSFSPVWSLALSFMRHNCVCHWGISLQVNGYQVSTVSLVRIVRRAQLDNQPIDSYHDGVQEETGGLSRCCPALCSLTGPRIAAGPPGSSAAPSWGSETVDKTLAHTCTHTYTRVLSHRAPNTCSALACQSCTSDWIHYTPLSHYSDYLLDLSGPFKFNIIRQII